MEDAKTAVETHQPTAQDHPDAASYCPCCSKRLTERRCKLLCETCGYFMSCADFY